MKFVKHYDKNYSVICNDVLRDKNLSSAAKGLFCFLWSCSDDFHITVRGLQAVVKEGTRAICSMLNELKEAGYIRARQESNGNGFQKGEYDLRDSKNTPFQDKPKADTQSVHTQNAYTRNVHTQDVHPRNVCTQNVCTRNADTEEILIEEVPIKEIPREEISTQEPYYPSSSHINTIQENKNKQIKKKADVDDGRAKRKDFEKPTSWETRDYAFTKCGDMSIGDEFFWYYFHRDWQINGSQIRDWRALLDSWIAKNRRKGDESNEYGDTRPFHIPHCGETLDNYDFERECWIS